jgi:hypothetical protein
VSPWPASFSSSGTSTALVSWVESPIQFGPTNTYLSRFVDGAFDEPRLLLEESEGQDSSVRLASTRTDRVAMMSCVGDVTDEVARSLSLSEDGAATFLVPQTLDFLRSNDVLDGSDSFCPHVGLDDHGRVHLLWTRYPVEDEEYTILYSRGEPVAPCSP